VSSVVNRFVNGVIQIGARNPFGPFGGLIDPFCEPPGHAFPAFSGRRLGDAISRQADVLFGIERAPQQRF
jgi:hypothetical protein